MSFVETLLWPLSLLYGGIVRGRVFFFRHGLRKTERLDGIVVSVGNLSVGGTGKTPMTLWLAERFARGGRKTAILCRGYRPLLPERRSGNGIREGQPKAWPNNWPRNWNDEAAMLHTRLGGSVEVAASADRYEAGRELERGGFDCFILDDGFQHLQLARDVNMLMIDGANPFGNGRVLPAGRLREPISALRRADLVVITRSNRAPAVEAVIKRHATAPVFYADAGLLGIEPLDCAQESCGTKDLIPSAGFARKYFAFCGIGNPAAFWSDLDKWGIAIAGRRAFRDHHLYTEEDLRGLEREAEMSGANALLCTEKDIFDLGPFRAERLPIFFCRIALRPANEDALWNFILERVQKRKPESLMRAAR